MKADACDLTAGLRESTEHKWSGDVDLGDGSLATVYKEQARSKQNLSCQAKDVILRQRGVAMPHLC